MPLRGAGSDIGLLLGSVTETDSQGSCYAFYVFDVPPPPPPVLTAQQAADVECVRVGRTDIASNPNSLLGPKIVRIYLARLVASDRTRPWDKMTPPFSGDMLYGDFMGAMNRCMDTGWKAPRKR